MAQLISNKEEGGHIVQTETLDALADAHSLSRLDMVKIDVEGHEGKVLRGGLKTIRRFRPILIVEINPSALSEFGSSPEEIVKLQTDLGYSLRIPTWRGLIHYDPDRRINGFVNAIGFPRS